MNNRKIKKQKLDIRDVKSFLTLLEMTKTGNYNQLDVVGSSYFYLRNVFPSLKFLHTKASVFPSEVEGKVSLLADQYRLTTNSTPTPTPTLLTRSRVGRIDGGLPVGESEYQLAIAALEVEDDNLWEVTKNIPLTVVSRGIKDDLSFSFYW